MNLLADLQYFSPLSAFKYSIHVTNIFFNIYEVSGKLSFRNRCIIAGANGLLHLSVPLEGGRDQKLAQKELRIANEDKWQMDHWRSITSAYNRSPWFEFYRQDLEIFYRKSFNYLVDWNLELFEWVARTLGITAKIHLLQNADQQKNVFTEYDIRNKWQPKNFNCDPMVASLRYRQVFEERIGFQSNLSILDLLFCEGKNSRSILETNPEL